jgi:hypothetical protein
MLLACPLLLRDYYCATRFGLPATAGRRVSALLYFFTASLLQLDLQLRVAERGNLQLAGGAAGEACS